MGDIAEVDAYLLDRANARSASVQLQVPTVTELPTLTTEDAISCIGPHAQSEARTTNETSSDLPLTRGSITEVSIKTRPPQGAKRYTSVLNYHTASIDKCHSYEEPAKDAFDEKKRALLEASPDPRDNAMRQSLAIRTGTLVAKGSPALRQT